MGKVSPDNNKKYRACDLARKSVINLSKELQEARSNEIDYRYKLQPIDPSIPDLKREDNQDYSDWRKLPKFVTV